MKLVLLILSSLLIGAQSFAGKDCSAQAENYLTNVGYTQPATFVGFDSEGHQVYYVRSNLQGGDAAYEVTVNAHDCSYVSHLLLWSE